MSLVIKFQPGLRPVIKHEQHDQSSHGNWAEGTVSNVQYTLVPKDKIYRGDVIKEEILRADITIKNETFKLLQTNEKYDDNTVIMNLSVKDSNGKIIARMGTSSQFTNEKDTVKITGIEVATQHRRKGIATTMLTFARKHAIDGIKIQHDTSRLSAEGKAWADVVKHEGGGHDQKTHGSWATGQKGGSGLSHREMFELKRNRQDPMVRKVYEAEEKNHNQIQDKNADMPSAPNRADFDEYSDYNDAYKKYSKDFLNWSRKVTTSVISDTGKKHLDGTPRGVNGYVRDVLRQDWFVEQFGKGGVAGSNLEVKVSSAGEAGAYQIGFKGDLPVSILRVNRGYSKAEPTIVHEIAHYATTISATSPHDGHGVEFVRNHIFISSKVFGQSFADQLESTYREAGIPLGD